MDKVIIIADAHLESGEECHPSYKLAKKFIKNQKPNYLILLGDMLDFSYLSTYNEQKALFRENKRLYKDYALFNKELDFFQKYCNKVIYLEGNHERRVEATIEKYPQFQNSIEVPINLKLKQRGINWYSEKEQPIHLGDLCFLHGKYYTIFYTKKTLEEYGVNLIIAHCHRPQMFSKTFSGTGTELMCYGLPCLTDKRPDYLNGRSTDHQNGLGIAFVEKAGDFSFYAINIKNNHFIYNGKDWRE